MRSLGRVVGWRTCDEVVVFEGVGVAVGGVDAEPEQVGDGFDVAGGGVCFGEDAVLAQLAWGDSGADAAAQPHGVDGLVASVAVLVDEEVAVGGGWPSGGAVVEPGGDAFSDGFGERDAAAVDGESAVDDVSELDALQLAHPDAVEGDERDHHGGGRVVGEQEFSDVLDVVGVQGEWLVAGVLAGLDAGGGVEEEDLAGFEEPEDRLEPLAGSRSFGTGSGECVEDVFLGDLSQAGVPGSGPLPHDRQRPGQVQGDGLVATRATSRRDPGAVLHDVEPGLEFGDHGAGQAGDALDEPGVDGGDPVFDEGAGGGEDLEHGPHAHVDVAEGLDFAGPDRGAAVGLDTEHDPGAEDGLVALPTAPLAGVGDLVGDGFQRCDVVGVRALVEPSTAVAGQVRRHGEQRQLLIAVPQPLRFGLLLRYGRLSRTVGVSVGRDVGGRCADASTANACVDEEQLLAVAVGADDVEGAAGFAVVAGVLVTEPADAASAEGQGAVAGQAGSVSATGGGVGVLGSPVHASWTQPLVGASGAPGQTIQAGVDARIGVGVAPLAQPCREVARVGAAPQAWWRADGPAGPAAEAVVDPGHGHRRGRAGEAASESSALAAGEGHRCCSACEDQAGGSVRLRPSRGVTFAGRWPSPVWRLVWPPSLTSASRPMPPPASPRVSPTAWASRACWRRASTLAGSGMRSSAAVHSKTAQITSRSSSRTVVGVVVHSIDIFPALMVSPASASIWRSSTDFQIPRSAAFIRRFHFISSLLYCRFSHRRCSDQPLRDALVGPLPGIFDVGLVDVDVHGGRRQPGVAQQFLDGLESDALVIEVGRAVVPQRVWGQLAVPVGQPTGDRGVEAVAKRFGAGAGAASGVGVTALAGEHGCVGVFPVVGELVSHVGQPPGQQVVDAVDAGYQAGLRSAAVGALAESDVKLARGPQVGAPVADVEHGGLVDPQPDPAPQRGGDVVAGCRQVLACPGQRSTPVGEECFYVLGRWRDPAGAVVGLRRAVELIDRLVEDRPGERMDVAPVAGTEEVEEPRDRTSLALDRAGCLSSRGPQRPQPPVGIVWRRGPYVATQEPGELDDRGPLAQHRGVHRTRGRQGQTPLIDQLLLEVVEVGRGRQTPRGPQRSDDRKSIRHQSPRSVAIRRDSMHCFTNHDATSIASRDRKAGDDQC